MRPEEMESLQQLQAQEQPQEEPTGQRQEQAPQSEQGVQQKVGEVFQGLVEAGKAMVDIDPRLTTIVKSTVEKLYNEVANFYGKGDEAKLAMKQAQGQQQTQGMNQMAAQ